MTIGCESPNCSEESATPSGGSKSIPNEGSARQEVRSIDNFSLNAKENLSCPDDVGNEGADSPHCDGLQKPGAIDVDPSPTLTETFSISGEVTCTPARNDSLFMTSTADCEESRLVESRNCSMNDDRIDDDDEREDSTPNQNSEPFLQTRVEYTEPFVEKERACVFLMSSSESWDCDAARETSLFDGDDDDDDGGSCELRDWDKTGLQELQAEAAPLSFVKNASPNLDDKSRWHSESTAGRFCGEPIGGSTAYVFHNFLHCFQTTKSGRWNAQGGAEQ
ncbi:hypothetical protein MHU86_3427 [Fragilaria crotonensis]|nr:hypothetical protein MHU86_3427 [Fragilaria crotonensis]